MKTSLSLFKHIYTLIIISFFIFTLSCSEDPSSPQNENETPLTTKSIGPEGGVIEAEDVSIEIPAGTFDNIYEITVSSITDDNTFDGYTISNSYNLKGLPENLNKRIRLAINYSGELNEETYLALGSTYLDNISNEESTFYNIFPGIDSSGYFVAYLENYSSPHLSKFSSTNDDTEKIIKIINSLRTVSSEHFKITFPTILSSAIPEAATNLEDAFSIVIDDLGLFNYTEHSDKISVLISKQSEGVKLNLWKLLWDQNSSPDYALNINYELVSSKNFQSIKYNFGIQLIDLWMATKMKALQSKNWASSSYQWLKSAFLTWAEELFSDESTFESPYNFKYNPMTPFEGLTLGAGQFWDTQNKHGHGMSSLIKYLDKNYLGNQIVKKTFSTISNDIAPDLALFNNVDELFTEWFPHFFKEYLSGNVYELSKDYFITNAHHSWSINTETDTLKEFNSTEVGNYPDLSAKLFRIDMNYSGFEETQNLILSMKGPVTEDGLSLVVFGIQNGETFYLETAHAQDFEIPNLKDYYDNNMRQFLVLLVNSLGNPPYDKESDIDLEIRITKNSNGGSGGNGEFDYNYCELQLFTNKFYERENGSTFEQETVEVAQAEGEMIGNRFVGKNEFYAFADTLEVVLTESGDSILLLDWTSYYRDPYSNTTHKQVIEAFGIPIFDPQNGVFKVSGIQTCGNVTHYSYELNSQGNLTTLKSFNCNENSFLEIRLYKRD